MTDRTSDTGPARDELTDRLVSLALAGGRQDIADGLRRIAIEATLPAPDPAPVREALLRKGLTAIAETSTDSASRLLAESMLANLAALAARPGPSGDADAAWDALAELIYDYGVSTEDAVGAIARHRPLIEAALRATAPSDGMEPVLWMGSGEPVSGSVAAYKALHPFGPICGVISASGPNGEPLACGYPQNPPGERMHEHSWATLPTFGAAPSDGAGGQTLLDRIRDETRQAVIEGDADDCSSPDCIADAVYEIVRAALSGPTP